MTLTWNPNADMANCSECRRRTDYYLDTATGRTWCSNCVRMHPEWSLEVRAMVHRLAAYHGGENLVTRVFERAILQQHRRLPRFWIALSETKELGPYKTEDMALRMARALLRKEAKPS